MIVGRARVDRAHRHAKRGCAVALHRSWLGLTVCLLQRRFWAFINAHPNGDGAAYVFALMWMPGTGGGVWRVASLDAR